MTHADLQQSIREAADKRRVEESIQKLLELQCQLLWEIQQQLKPRSTWETGPR